RPTGSQGGAAALRAAGEAVGPCLPVEAAATEVTLLAGPPPGVPGTPPGQWRRAAAFPLDEAPPSLRPRSGARGQPVTWRSSMTICTPFAIQTAPTTASCSAAVRTWPASRTVFPRVTAVISLSSG